jgi:hypothetical protein
VGSVYQARKQFSLLADNLCAQRGELVVTTTGVVWGSRITGSRFTDQLVSYEPCEGPIERARSEPRSTVSELVHETHDGVSMALSRRQGKQHLKAGRGQCRAITCRTHDD